MPPDGTVARAVVGYIVACAVLGVLGAAHPELDPNAADSDADLATGVPTMRSEQSTTVTESDGTYVLGGRRIVAFVEVSECGRNRIKSIDPLPVNKLVGMTLDRGITESVTVWGIESSYGQRIWEAYESGSLPTDDVDTLNRVLDGDANAE